MARLSADQWATYWQHRTITSFHGHFQHNYDGSIKQFWDAQFSSQPPHARILDLGTGNGALALLAAEYSRNHDKEFLITAIDFADIDPTQLIYTQPELRELLESIEFIGKRLMESTALPGASWNLVMSQFGFEYGDTTRTLDEIERLLVPHKGRFCAMIHHQDSAILSQARDAIEQLVLCGESPAPGIAKQLAYLQEKVDRQGRLEKADQQKAEKLHKSFLEELTQLQNQEERFLDPSALHLFTNSLILLFDRSNAERLTPQQRLQAIRQLKQDNETYMLRMQDLLSAAFSDENFDSLLQALQYRGFKVETFAPVLYDKQFFCASLVARYK